MKKLMEAVQMINDLKEEYLRAMSQSETNEDYKVLAHSYKMDKAA